MIVIRLSILCSHRIPVFSEFLAGFIKTISALLAIPRRDEH